MKLTPERIALLRKIKRKIRKAPGSYNQGTWHKKVKPNIAPCGTACCIAGWACLLSGKYRESATKDNKVYMSTLRGREIDPQMTAKRLLGLSWDEEATLFSGEPDFDWPLPFSDDWRKAGKKRSRAARQEAMVEVACAYIDHIIKTGEVEYVDNGRSMG